MTISTNTRGMPIPTPDRPTDRRADRASSAAYAALSWVALFFALHVYWYLGGSFASPGYLPGGPHSLLAWASSVIVTGAFPLGALVCLAIAWGWARGRLASAAQALVAAACVLLLARGGAGVLDDLTRATGLLQNGITGLSVQEATGHPHLRWADWAIDGYFLLGGALFGLLALRHRARPTRSGRDGSADRSREPDGGNEHGVTREAPVFGDLAQQQVPRWATRLAHVVPLLVLPSGLWRLAIAFGFPMGQLDDSGELWVVRGWTAVYIAALSVLAEAVALTAFGLVQPLGEEVPRWVPFIGGRAVRPRAVTMAGTAGSLVLMAIWTVGFWDAWTGDYIRQPPSTVASPFWGAVFTACYAPLNLWGPALLALTWAFHRRARPASVRPC